MPRTDAASELARLQRCHTMTHTSTLTPTLCGSNADALFRQMGVPELASHSVPLEQPALSATVYSEGGGNNVTSETNMMRADVKKLVGSSLRLRLEHHLERRLQSAFHSLQKNYGTGLYATASEELQAHRRVADELHAEAFLEANKDIRKSKDRAKAELDAIQTTLESTRRVARVEAAALREAAAYDLDRARRRSSQEVASLEAQRYQDQKEIAELQAIIAGADEEVAGLRRQKADLVSRVAELEKLNAGLQTLNAGFRDLNVELETQNLELTDRNAELEDRNDALEGAVSDPPAADITTKNNPDNNTDVDNMMAEIERLHRLNIHLEEEIANLAERNAELEEARYRYSGAAGGASETQWLHGKMALECKKSRTQIARLIAARIDKQEENECLRAHCNSQNLELVSLQSQVESQAHALGELRAHRDEQSLRIQELQAQCENAQILASIAELQILAIEQTQSQRSGEIGQKAWEEKVRAIEGLATLDAERGASALDLEDPAGPGLDTAAPGLDKLTSTGLTSPGKETSMLQKLLTLQPASAFGASVQPGSHTALCLHTAEGTELLLEHAQCLVAHIQRLREPETVPPDMPPDMPPVVSPHELEAIVKAERDARIQAEATVARLQHQLQEKQTASAAAMPVWEAMVQASEGVPARLVEASEARAEAEASARDAQQRVKAMRAMLDQALARGEILESEGVDVGARLLQMQVRLNRETEARHQAEQGLEALEVVVQAETESRVAAEATAMTLQTELALAQEEDFPGSSPLRDTIAEEPSPSLAESKTAAALLADLTPLERHEALEAMSPVRRAAVHDLIRERSMRSVRACEASHVGVAVAEAEIVVEEAETEVVVDNHSTSGVTKDDALLQLQSIRDDIHSAVAAQAAKASD